MVDRNRPAPTDAEGATRVARLHPGTYVLSIAGRADVPPVQVTVSEGADSDVVLEAP